MKMLLHNIACMWMTCLIVEGLWFNIVSMVAQTQTHRIVLEPFSAFVIDREVESLL